MSENLEVLERLLKNVTRFQCVAVGLTLACVTVTNLGLALAFYMIANNHLNIALAVIDNKFKSIEARQSQQHPNSNSVNIASPRTFDDNVLEYLRMKYLPQPPKE